MIEFARNILLTGASGFVGRRLAARLRALATSGGVLAALDRLAPLDGWTPVNIDIRDEGEVARAIAEVRPDLVVHLAAQSSVALAHGSTEETWRTNFGGTLAIASACARLAPAATLLFASTSEVYGASFIDGVASETTALRPMNAYARSKAAGESMLIDVLAPTNRLITTRAFNHTGAGQNTSFVLPSFALQIARIAKGRQPPVVSVGNLSAARDFLHVDDVLEAYILLLARRNELPVRSTFNICSGKTHSLQSLLESMRDLAAVPFEIHVDPNRLRASDIPNAAGSSALLRDSIGWSPKIALTDLLRELLQAAASSVE